MLLNEFTILASSKVKWNSAGSSSRSGAHRYKMMINVLRAGDYQHRAEKVVSITRKGLSVFGLHEWIGDAQEKPPDRKKGLAANSVP